MAQANNANQPEQSAVIASSQWKVLYRAGALAALISVVGIPLQIVAYIISPPPATALGYFNLFQSNWLLGLASMDLFYLATNILLVLTFPALYIILQRTNPPLAILGTLLGLVGIVALITARPSLEMLTLSQRYAAASTDAQRTVLLAAGELIVVMFNGTAYQLHLIVGALGLLLLAIAMLRSDVFSRATAYVGIAANAVTLGYFLPGVGIYLLLLSVLFYWIWYLQIARTLFRIR
jgi:hypothetical protein